MIKHPTPAAFNSGAIECNKKNLKIEVKGKNQGKGSQ